MADIIRKVTVEKGFDPRDFVLFAFGGAGTGARRRLCRELGVRKVIVPQRKAASTWCAFGAAAADVLHIFEHTEIMQTPVDCYSNQQYLWNCWNKKRARPMAEEGIAENRQRFEFSLDVRHKGQINEVEVLLPSTRLASQYEGDPAGSASSAATSSSMAAAPRWRARSSRSSSAACAPRALTPQPRLAQGEKDLLPYPCRRRKEEARDLLARPEEEATDGRSTTANGW